MYRRPARDTSITATCRRYVTASIPNTGVGHPLSLETQGSLFRFGAAGDGHAANTVSAAQTAQYGRTHRAEPGIPRLAVDGSRGPTQALSTLEMQTHTSAPVESRQLAPSDQIGFCSVVSYHRAACPTDEAEGRLLISPDATRIHDEGISTPRLLAPIQAF